MQENTDYEVFADQTPVAASNRPSAEAAYAEHGPRVLTRLPDLKRPAESSRTPSPRSARWDAKRLLSQPTSIRLLVGGGVLLVFVAIFPWLFSSDSQPQQPGQAVPSWHPGVPAPNADAAPAWEPSDTQAGSVPERPHVVQPTAPQFDLEYRVPSPPDGEIAAAPWGHQPTAAREATPQVTAAWPDHAQGASGGPPHLMAPPEVRPSPEPVAERTPDSHERYKAARPYPAYHNEYRGEPAGMPSSQAQPNRPMALEGTATERSVPPQSSSRQPAWGENPYAYQNPSMSPSYAAPQQAATPQASPQAAPLYGQYEQHGQYGRGASPYGVPQQPQASQQPAWQYGSPPPAQAPYGAAEQYTPRYGASQPTQGAYGGASYGAAEQDAPSYGAWRQAEAPTEPGMARFEGHIATPPVRTMQ